MAEHTTSAGLDARKTAAQFLLRICADKQYRVRVKVPECLVGRAADAQLRIAHPQVAPHHCRLFWNKHQLWVKALQGDVVLQGRLLDQALLRPGDCLQLGPVQVEVLAICPPAAETEQPDQPALSQPSDPPAPSEPGPPDSWWAGVSQRLDHIEHLCRQFRSEENELAEFSVRLERIEEQLNRQQPQRLLREALAPLEQRLRRLERRYRRLARRWQRWWEQQGHWQQQLDRQLLHYSQQAQQLDQQVQQARAWLDQACSDQRELAERVSQLGQPEEGSAEQAVAEAVQQAIAPVFQQVEHLERRFRELEQWTRCLRRELRGEMHSEVESRLADLRAEREALETLRQSQNSPGGTMPVTAPGVGFPVAKEKEKGKNHSTSESASEAEFSAGAPSAEASSREPASAEVCQEPPSQTPPASSVCEGEIASPSSPQPICEPPQETAAEAVHEEHPSRGEETAPPVSQPEEEKAAAGEPEQADTTAQQNDPPTPAQQPAEEAESYVAPACSLSTVELFRRLGIQVPGMEEEPGAADSPDGAQETASEEAAGQALPDHRLQPEASLEEPTDLPPEADSAPEGETEDLQAPAAATFDGESVEDYMARLLKSIAPEADTAAAASEQPASPKEEEPEKAEATASPQPVASSLSEEVPVAEEPLGEIEVSPEALKAAPGSLPAALEEPNKAPAQRVVPAESPETLHSLRRLANTSARTAIETYQRRLKLSATQTKLLLSVLAMLASFAMMWFAGSLPHKWVYGAALGSLGISIYYGLRYLMLTAQSPGGEEELLEEE